MTQIRNIVSMAAAAIVALTADTALTEPAVPPCTDDAMIVFHGGGHGG